VNQPSSKQLWQLLQAVAHAVMQVTQGTSGTAALEAVSPTLRPGMQALFFQVLRQLGRAQALRDQLVKRPPPALVDALLCSALALVWDEAQAPYEPFTLVNQAVETAKKTRALHAQANFLNACLRRFLREREALVAKTQNNLQAVWNHPIWWIKRLQKDYPSGWDAILRANNCAAPMSLRVNVQRVTRQALLERWLEAGLAAQVVGDQGLTLTSARAVHELPGFSEGLCSVQDPAAQHAASALLSNRSDQPLRVLDACAAPGGKTAHLLELLPAHSQVIALEIDALRAQRIGQNLARLGLQAQIQVANAAQVDQWWDGVAFDAVLLDAPCSASGIVRRHPDVRWLRRETDIAQLAKIQQDLLQKLWQVLKPGGRLLYCTCSVFKAEGEDQAKAFVQRNTDAHLLPSVGHLKPQNTPLDPALVDNLAGDHDGFYYALLEKIERA
jgi:16S rRNA (cytosine967-C5)-methyltransferase